VLLSVTKCYVSVMTVLWQCSGSVKQCYSTVTALLWQCYAMLAPVLACVEPTPGLICGNSCLQSAERRAHSRGAHPPTAPARGKARGGTYRDVRECYVMQCDAA
jgi:hypothetical protein